ncbi:PLDc N-terminal domain-containing protein [Pseudomonas sp. JDS28PS106]|uniref:PLDc N-terminal domain-containing protein n=1 Tax=Pseudomonas sp. JDS28PS106 TaxID=2497235 RepID=UPI002FD6EA9B
MLSESDLWLFTLITALVVIADIWAIMRVRKTVTASNDKLMWMIVIVAVPILGVLALLIAGPRHVPRPAEPGKQGTKY